MSLFMINFKLYNEVLGSKGEEIAKAAKAISTKLGINIVIAPAFSDIRLIGKEISVIAQHIDPIEPGAHTGHITAEAVKESGAIGTLINHSEKKISIKDVEKCISIAKKNNLMTICCAASPQESAILAKLNPDYILIEPPELIGGDRSVSKTNPEIISDTVKLVKATNESVGIICGAGVSTGEDAKIARQLGAIGVGVASAITKSQTPEKVIEDIAYGLIG